MSISFPKNINYKKIIKELLSTIILVSVMAATISYIRQPKLDSKQLAPLKGVLINQKPFDLSRYKNQAVMIHFWATWCPICRTEVGNIETVSKHFNLLSIAVKSGSDEELLKFMKEHNLDYDVYNDTDGILASKFHINSYPTTLIYNTKGELSFAEVGYTTTLGLYLRLWWASL